MKKFMIFTGDPLCYEVEECFTFGRVYETTDSVDYPGQQFYVQDDGGCLWCMRYSDHIFEDVDDGEPVDGKFDVFQKQTGAKLWYAVINGDYYCWSGDQWYASLNSDEYNDAMYAQAAREFRIYRLKLKGEISND